MKLNADLVCSVLAERYAVRMMGPRTLEMNLSRPEIYLDNETEFLADHLYIATVEHLPLHPKLGRNTVIVVIGDGVQLSHYREQCCLIVIREKADFFAVNRFLCRMFDRYYAWERELFESFLGNADLAQILSCSKPIFRRPLYVLDASLRYLASSESRVSEASLHPANMGAYLSSFELITERHEPTVLNLQDSEYLCINLFDESDHYLGCLYLDGNGRPFSEGEKVLAAFLARLAEKSIEKNPTILSEDSVTLKNAVMNLLNNYPLTANQKWKLNLSSNSGQFLCICLHGAKRHSRLPENYLCTAFEEVFPGSFAFPKGNAIVCFLNTALLPAQKGGYYAELNRKLHRFLADTHSIAGVSNGFSDWNNARIAYTQAETAIESGTIASPETDLFYFQSYALISMIVNSIGNLPAEAYFSERLQNLIAHDRSAAVSYLDTLRVFLRSSQSISQTAEELYIHRSTVVDRIARIERELDISLKDPDTRLQLEIILKAMEIEKMVQQAKS